MTSIEWCDTTVNPIVGCLNNCSYCYAKRLAPHVARQVAATTHKPICQDCLTFTPHLHFERLGQLCKVRKPALVFADSMADWWSDGVDPRWRVWACEVMEWAVQHRFIVLTKRPDRITDTSYWPSSAWLGVSITSGADWWRWEALAKLPERIHKFISVEPLLAGGIGTMIGMNRMEGKPLPEWVIMGPQSGAGAVKPNVQMQDAIQEACENAGIPLFEKPGLPLQPAIRQMPADLAAVYRKGGLDA